MNCSRPSASTTSTPTRCSAAAVRLGNLDSLRDWGHARDYVEMQWRMLQQEGPPEDFVIATGRQESVRRFIELAALELGWGEIAWRGEGIEEIGQRSSGEVVVRIDPRYFRPAEVETLLGDPSKAHAKLGWTPTTTLEQLVAEMVAADREEARKEAILRLKGFKVVGSMENPPANPRAVEQARGGQG
jgi:GDPmannose 4,6-dehydratase